MKILIKYKHGFFGAVRKLQILANDETLISEIRQGESKHIEIPDKCKVIYGKMDWAETNKVENILGWKAHRNLSKMMKDAWNWQLKLAKKTSNT